MLQTGSYLIFSLDEALNLSLSSVLVTLNIWYGTIRRLLPIPQLGSSHFVSNKDILKCV